ncbi:MAG: hypothetical protein ACJATP_001428 [Candidatus Azotimanducaceae bacterium]|jgi:hypothetical protein
MINAKSAVALKDIISTPEWFPASIDADNQEIVFINVDKKSLINASFHDGRTAIEYTRDPVRVSIDAAIDCANNTPMPETITRIVAHTSFCGSTLLSRLLSLGGACFAYREPQVLVELTALKVQSHQLSGVSDLWSRLVGFIVGQFSLPWTHGQGVLLKPSNWANGLLNDLPSNQNYRIVAMTSSISSYLCAHLRGGDARIRYSLNLLKSLRHMIDGLGARIDHIEKLPLSPLSNVLHLLAFCLLAQESLIRQAQQRFEQPLRLTKEQLLENPEWATLASANALGLSQTQAVGIGFHATLQSNAKEDHASRYSVSKEEAYTEELMQSCGRDISAACDWYTQQAI